ncbi:PAS domain S-box protein [Desulfobacterales bacterium HSG2]|nr:PAS domain S-box protein [Desulfobacterales bacterium HSG2]
MKVLIVEDNSIDTLLFATVVRERGHEVMACISAESALESCQKIFYPLIIADIGLPGMDGLEFCRRVRALPRGKYCFILVITGSPDPENIKKSLDAGADDYLTKPADTRLLEIRLEIAERLARDRTKQKVSEENLRKSEAAALPIMNSSSDLAVVLDTDGTILTANTALTQKFGKEMNEVGGLHISDLFPPDTAKFRNKFVQKIVQTGKPLRFEDKDNGDYWDNSYNPVFDESGNVSAVSAFAYNITKYKETREKLRRSEAALRESGKYFSAIFKQNPIGIIIGDMNRNILDCNPAIQEMLGYRREELIGKNVRDISHPDDDKKNLGHYKKMDGRCDTFQMEKRYFRKDGSIIWTRLTVSNIISETDGEPEFLLGMIQDISLRKEMEKTLTETEARVQYLLASVPVVIYTCKPYGDYPATFMTESVRKQLGYEPHEFIDNSSFWADHIHPEDAPRVFSGLAQLPEKGHHFYEYRFQHKNGTYRWMRDELRLMTDTQGNPSEIIGYWTDIDDRKHTEEALRENEARYRAIVEDQTELICRYLSDGTLTFVNEAYCRYFEKRSEELIGKPFLPLIPKEDHKIIEEMIGSLTPENPVVTIKHRVIMPDSRIRWLQWTNRAILKDQSRIVEYQAVGRDISELRQTQNEVQEAKNAAESANQAKSEFLANMSHEFRTPLNGILGYTQFLRRDNTLTDKQLKAIDIIHRSGEHLLMLITDILDLSKIEARQMELMKTELHLHEFLSNIVQITQVRAMEKGISLIYKPASDLPKGVFADEKRLRQVLLNLLSNAVKFTEKGRVVFSVSRPLSVVRSQSSVAENNGPQTTDHGPRTTDNRQRTTDNRQQTNQIRFQVEDTGIGIPKEKLKEIFLPFRQAGNTQTHNEGSGLGLSISRKLVRMMGSVLYVKSTVGQGSVFRFDADLPEVKWDTETIKVEKRHIVGYKGDRRKILIAEDLDQSRMILKDILLSSGFEVIEAVNGKDAVNKALEFRPDLILMDLMMPESDGFEATMTIREIPELKDVPVIAVSATVFRQTREASLAAGCDDYIAKPVDLEELMGLLKSLMNLEWIYESQNDTPKVPADVPVIPPPKESLDEIFRLAMCGDVTGVQERMKELDASDPELIPFGEKIRQFAKELLIDEIQDFIEQFM